MSAQSADVRTLSRHSVGPLVDFRYQANLQASLLWQDKRLGDAQPPGLLRLATVFIAKPSNLANVTQPPLRALAALCRTEGGGVHWTLDACV